MFKTKISIQMIYDNVPLSENVHSYVPVHKKIKKYSFMSTIDENVSALLNIKIVYITVVCVVISATTLFTFIILF